MLMIKNSFQKVVVVLDAGPSNILSETGSSMMVKQH